MTRKGQTDVILLDFDKAFDKVPHRRLLHKLNYYGVRESTLCWIESFLSQRKQSVLLDGTQSTEPDVLSGEPQGKVLGPYFFWPILMTCQSPQITQMPDCFADDCRLYRHVTSSQDQALLQQDLSALERWEETWQIKFHPDNCTIIRISAKKNRS